MIYTPMGLYHQAIEVPLKLTPEQENQVRRTIGCCRFVYNWALSTSIDFYKENKGKVDENGKKMKSCLSTFDLNKLLTPFKQQKGVEWLNEVNNAALQQSIADMSKAFSNFSKNKKHFGFPKFKSKHKSKKSYRLTNNSVYFKVVKHKKKKKRSGNIVKDQIKLPNLGWVDCVFPKLFRPNTFKLMNVTIKEYKAGKFMAVLCVQPLKEAPEPKTAEESTTIGIDLGINHLFVTSEGTKIENKKFYKTYEPKIKKAQRMLSRKTKGSNRYKKQQHSLRKHHERLKNVENNYLHHVINECIGDNQTVVLESLKAINMMKNHKLAKSLAHAKFGMIKSMFEYKCLKKGVAFIQIGQYYPSSKTCSCCDHKVDKMPLSVREWTCEKCNTQHDRDVNAAINIKAEGLRLAKKENLPAGSGSEHAESHIIELVLLEMMKREPNNIARCKTGV